MEPRYKELPRIEDAERMKNPTGGCLERKLEALTIGICSEAEAKYHERRAGIARCRRESFRETPKMQR